MDSAPFIIFGLFALLAIIAILFGHQQAKKRREALSQLAAQHRWRFLPDKDPQHTKQYQHSDFRIGSARYAYNSLLGELTVQGQKWPFKAGDFHYQTTRTDSDGKTKTHHHHFSYLVVHLPFAQLPELDVRQESFFDRIGATFGFDDIDFESVAFSNKFHVTSSDKRFAYDLINPRMMEFLLGESGPAFSLRNQVFCFRKGGVWKPEQFVEQMRWAETFFELWPAHLVQQLAAVAPPSNA